MGATIFAQGRGCAVKVWVVVLGAERDGRVEPDFRGEVVWCVLVGYDIFAVFVIYLFDVIS